MGKMDLEKQVEQYLKSKMGKNLISNYKWAKNGGSSE
jgi:hypothetical protein